MRSCIYFIASMMLLSSCSGRNDQNAGITSLTHISGYIEDGAASPLLIERITPDGFVVADSLYLDRNSEFESAIRVDYPGFYAVKNSNGDYITIFCEGNDSVKIYSNYFNFNQFRLEGSDENRSITELNNATQSFLDTIAIFAAIIRDSSVSPDYRAIKIETDIKYQEAFQNFKHFSEEFINRNEGSLVSLLALSNEVGPGLFVFHPIRDREIFLRTDSILMSRYPESEPVRKIHEQLQIINQSVNPAISGPKPGDLAPEIVIKGTDEQIIRLSDIKNKVVLIDFWASWSQPSRKQNKELAKIYRKHHHNGFEILQVSLDRKKQEWIQAIKEDSLTWFHGSELDFWDSDIASNYGVSSLPSNFLVGKNGRILYSNLGPPELDTLLKNILID